STTSRAPRVRRIRGGLSPSTPDSAASTPHSSWRSPMESRPTTASPQDAAIVSGACLAPWGERAANLPGAADAELPPLSGFVVSRFSPLVAEVVRRCLAGHDVAGPAT